jgi:hypothetical protein
MKPHTIAAARSIHHYELRTLDGKVLWTSDRGGMFGDWDAPSVAMAREHGTIEKWAVWEDQPRRTGASMPTCHPLSRRSRHS